MKIKNIRLEIQSENEFIAEAKEAMKAAARAEGRASICYLFESLKAMKVHHR